MGAGKTRRLLSRGVEGNLEKSAMPEHDGFYVTMALKNN
jgi:hypothetical protein